jgi:3-oxoacyl-[acyl-carrier-protein] synthase III
LPRVGEYHSQVPKADARAKPSDSAPFPAIFAGLHPQIATLLLGVLGHYPVSSAVTSNLVLLGTGLSVPQGRIPVARIFDAEQRRLGEQLDALSAGLRGRLLGNLGIDAVAHMEQRGSLEHAELAAKLALDRAGIEPNRIGLIVDFSTFSSDSPRLWSLAHALQGRLGAPEALAFGTRGSGCAGLHFALLLAEAFLSSRPDLSYALLVASDRAPDTGRLCLPISIMADAASALVVGRAEQNPKRLARICAIATQQHGRFADLLVVESDPYRMTIDGRTFEQSILPIHFVVLNRLLARAVKVSGLECPADLDIVYPNTTELDRASIARGMGIEPSRLIGPGPRRLGHAFASDLLINADAWLNREDDSPSAHSAWLAAGSGFSWGVTLMQREL